MASTNKTANLSLNQWVPTDPVLMEDMNEDNRKLDAALGAGVSVQLMNVTTDTSVSSVEFSFSGIDLSKFLYLRLFRISGAECSYIRINNRTDGYCYFDYLNNIQVAGACKFRGSLISIDLCSSGVLLTGHGKEEFWLPPGILKNPVDMTAIQAYGQNSTLPIGTRFILLGVKR